MIVAVCKRLTCSLVAAVICSCPCMTAAAQSAGSLEPVDVLSFFIFTVVLGIFTLHVLAFTRVPYTAILLVHPCSSRRIFCKLVLLVTDVQELENVSRTPI